ncbi:hypothetical protein [Cellulomonas chengniuliangii]|uniref:Secreted protein n=1 Tax=Cellulomonas chengniuliangii TaxID=2968084 RepID=A0ABY5L597_9CELL|nr:hypothetical protein [Cellulomonas chengniuliangii]MCC2308399.1 hypothetical protein [Cellulomonas chengniuliangii]MCC2317416.1 hypothetical protein [Cellulomonas chengniuliangii]UUI76777.1 hypothetical protein NP064_07860 [Cellulomonas chengniuliangii]
MRRLVWVAVGVGLTIVVIRKAGDVVDRYAPPGARQAAGALNQATTVAKGAKAEFLAAMREREEQLRRDLVGDVDVDAVREDRAKHRASQAETRRQRAAAQRWADEPTEDPEDDANVPYSFF